MSVADGDTTAKPQAARWAALCARAGVRHAVLSPGSRNAPLILAFHHQPGIECLVIPDERSAGHFALGLARATRRPVALACTSGTAALNYLPALAEAWHARVPLLALTADRPEEWIGHNDGQTIRQRGLYRHFVAYEGQLADGTDGPPGPAEIDGVFAAAQAALAGQRRPVHVNFPFREPLYDRVAADGNPARAAAPAAYAPRETGTPAIEWPPDAGRVLVLIGARDDAPPLRAAVARLAETGAAALLAECTANLPADRAPWMSEPLAAGLAGRGDLEPELLVSFGDMVLSKKLKTWLRAHPPRRHWVVTDESPPPDTFRRITHAWNIPAATFVEALLPHTGAMDPAFAERWRRFAAGGTARLRAAVATGPWCDLRALSLLGAALPGDGVVVLGNSTPVRYAQLVDWPAGSTFFVNRGVSGIDGVSSTAAGIAWGTDREVTLVTGDLAFQYDLNALWHRQLKENLCLVVMNNGGGNLFRLIEGPRGTGLSERYFETPVPVGIEPLCRAFDLNYLRAEGAAALTAALGAAPGRPHRPRVIEIVTDPEVNRLEWERLVKIGQETAP